MVDAMAVHTVGPVRALIDVFIAVGSRHAVVTVPDIPRTERDHVGDGRLCDE